MSANHVERAPFNRRFLPLIWIALAVIILWGDYVSGPDIAFPYFFLIPVVLASRYNGRIWGLCFAVFLPLVCLGYFFLRGDPASLQSTLLNVAIRMAILVSAALLVDRVIRQAEEIRALRGFLPMCAVCRKIRDSKQQWSSVETYLAEHSEATISHTLCPACSQNHYGEWMKESAPDKNRKLYSSERLGRRESVS